MRRGDHVVDHLVAHVGTVSATSSASHDLVALLVDHLALVVHHVVVLQQVLADVEVARLDLLLRLLERLVDPGMDDRLALLEAELAAACCPCARSRRCASGRLRATGRTWSAPGSPWRPERPRSWLSMRRLSCRSVPITYRPPACDHLLRLRARPRARSGRPLARARLRVLDRRQLLLPARISALPPSWMSVPRPAMLVAMVTAPSRPAWAMMCASCSW